MFKKMVLAVVLCVCVLTASAVQKVSLILDWLPNPDQAPLWLADELGLFQKHGLQVTLISPTDASDPAKMVAAGQVDLALTYQPSWLVSRARGLPLVWQANLIAQPLACVLVDPSQGIHQLGDLRHQTIAYSSGAIDSVLLATMLQYHGVALKEVQLLNVHYNLTQALLTHRVAAITGAMRNVEPIELKHQGMVTQAFYPEQNGVPPYAELIIVSRASQAKDPRFTAFVDALQEALLYIKAHPAESWRVFVKTHPELDTPTNAEIWQATYPYFTEQARHFDTAQNQRLLQFLQLKGALS